MMKDRILGAVALLATVVVVSALSGCSDAGGGGEAPLPKAFVFENPLRDAKPGEWARYQWEGDRIMLLTVREIDPITRQVMIEEEYRDPELNSLLTNDTLSLGPNHFLHGFDSAGAIILAMTFEKIRVAGHEWPCLRVDFVSPTQGEVRCWYSSEVPVTGLVKQVRHSQDGEEVVNVLLLDWAKDSVRPGRAGPSDDSGNPEKTD